jgi:PAS domain-containing protein
LSSAIGLCRIREEESDTLSSPISVFPNTSKHSFRFTPISEVELDLEKRRASIPTLASPPLETPVEIDDKSIKGRPPLSISTAPVQKRLERLKSAASPIHSPSRASPLNQPMVTTTADGVIVMANDLFRRMLDSEDDCVGKNVLSFIADPYRSKQESVLKQEGDVLLCGRIVGILFRASDDVDSIDDAERGIDCHRRLAEANAAK